MDDELRGELRDQLVAALQRVPETAGRELILTALSGGHHEPQLPGHARPATHERYVIRLAGNDTHLLGHQPRGRARGDRRGGRRRRRPGGHRLHPAGGLPRHPLHRRQRRSAGAGPPAGDPATRRGLASGASTAGRRSPACSCRCASWRRTGRWRRARRPESRGVGRARAVSAAASSGPPRAPIELRPCHNDLLNANFIDDGERIRIVDWEYAGMGDPFFDLGNFSVNHELDAGRGRDPAGGLRGRGAAALAWRGWP